MTSARVVAQPRFAPGERVRVRAGPAPIHTRTPRYVWGKAGTVVEYYGAFLNPEDMPYGGSGLPKKHLYRVEFEQGDLWPDYTGSSGDKVCVDIYEHWLQPDL